MLKSILFVDDEREILNSIKRGFMDEDYECFFANNALDAMSILAENEIAVIVSDMKMPEIGGLELLKKVKKEYPNTVKIVLTGYAQLSQILTTINQIDVFKFLLKPWKIDTELKPAVKQALDFYNAAKLTEKLKNELEKKNIMYEKILAASRIQSSDINADISNIRNVNNYVFSLIKTKLKQEPSDLKMAFNEISIIEDVFQSFLTVFPSKNMIFNVNKIQEDLNRLFPSEELKLEIKKESENQYRGNYGLYFMIISSLIKIIRNYSYMNMLNLDITENKTSISSEFRFLIQPSGLSNDSEAISYAYKRFSSILLLINEICKSLDTKLVAQKEDKNLIIINLSVGMERYTACLT